MVDNIVLFGDVQLIIDLGALAAFPGILRLRNWRTRRLACHCIANICDVGEDHVQAVIAADLFPVIVGLILSDPNQYVKAEAVTCITNALSNGSASQHRYLIQIGAVQPLCRSLRHFPSHVAGLALNALDTFLHLGEEDKAANGYHSNPVAELITECGGVALIDIFHPYVRPDLASMVDSLIETYFTENAAAVGPDAVAAEAGPTTTITTDSDCGIDFCGL